VRLGLLQHPDRVVRLDTEHSVRPVLGAAELDGVHAGRQRVDEGPVAVGDHRLHRHPRRHAVHAEERVQVVGGRQSYAERAGRRAAQQREVGQRLAVDFKVDAGHIGQLDPQAVSHLGRRGVRREDRVFLEVVQREEERRAARHRDAAAHAGRVAEGAAQEPHAAALPARRVGARGVQQRVVRRRQRKGPFPPLRGPLVIGAPRMLAVGVQRNNQDASGRRGAGCQHTQPHCQSEKEQSATHILPPADQLTVP
jgi:hypothetical protein